MTAGALTSAEVETLRWQHSSFQQKNLNMGKGKKDYHIF